MNEILKRQLALDYCCSPKDVESSENIFTVYEPRDGRRWFEETERTFLKIASVRGKLLVAADESILPWCKEEIGSCDGAWYFEPPQLAKLNAKLNTYGYEIAKIHPFYIAEATAQVDIGNFVITEYDRAAIKQFRGDTRFQMAFSFDEKAPDVIGISAKSSQNGEILGMAGASADSPLMWQIGINVEAGTRGQGVGAMLTALLKNRVLEAGRLPFYGTAFSHIVSQNVAIKAGFHPAWCELTTRKIK